MQHKVAHKPENVKATLRERSNERPYVNVQVAQGRESQDGQGHYRNELWTPTHHTQAATYPLFPLGAMC